MSLPVSRLVRVGMTFSPTAAAGRSFGSLLVLGDSNVISGLERIRGYNSYDAVAADFGSSAPEALAASAYFGQSPQPYQMYVGRWLRTASNGFNKGGILTAAEQTLSTFTAITNGGMVIVVDGVTKTLTGLNFSSAANLNAVATIVTTALAGAVCTWNGSQFLITSPTTGTSSSVGFATTGSGTDIAAKLKLTSALSAGLTPGYAAETPAAAVTALAAKSPAWYGVMFAASTMPTTNESLAVSGVVEALSLRRMYGVTTQDTNTLDSSSTSDLAYLMKQALYRQSMIQYSSSSLYAIASYFGRMFSVNFNGNNTTITMMYKQEPGIVGEDLTDAQADALKAKRCNVFAKYVNDTVIVQYGMMSGPYWSDEVHGLDWLQDAIQTAGYNALYTSLTKIPQTDAGSNMIVSAISGALSQAVDNGLVAPGVWNGPTIGSLQNGQYLKNGFYVYVPSMASQSQADRDARKMPVIQIALKLAGAIQELDVIVSVNR